MRLILASSSPRRKEILDLLGIPFDVIPPDIHETPGPDRTASEEVLYWSLEKAKAVKSDHSGAVVVASDTMIEHEGQKIGKPKNHDEALKILRSLAGRTHEVLTAVAVLLPGGGERSAIEKVIVTMRQVPDQRLVQYAATVEPLDKAGAYSIQGEGRMLVDRIDGDYLAVVGLPLRSLVELLRGTPISIPRDINRIYNEQSFKNWNTYS